MDKLDALVVICVAAVCLVSALMMPFMPRGETGDPVGLGVAAVCGGVLYAIFSMDRPR